MLKVRSELHTRIFQAGEKKKERESNEKDDRDFKKHKRNRKGGDFFTVPFNAKSREI